MGNIVKLKNGSNFPVEVSAVGVDQFPSFNIFSEPSAQYLSRANSIIWIGPMSKMFEITCIHSKFDFQHSGAFVTRVNRHPQ